MPDHRPLGPAAALAALAHGRDPEAWAALLATCGEVIRRCCARVLHGGPVVEDAIQETLLHLRDDAGQFHVPVGADADRAAWAWIRAVSVNTALQLLRSERRQRQRHEDHSMRAPVMASNPEPSEVVISREQANLVRDALAELPPAMRLAVAMHHLDGQAFADIGGTLGCREGTARSLAHRGLLLLRSQLARSGCALAIPALGAALAGMEASAETGAAGLAAGPVLLSQGGRASTAGLPASLPSPLPSLILIGLAGVGILAGVLLLVLRGAAAVESTPPEQGTEAPLLAASELDVEGRGLHGVDAYGIVDEEAIDPRSPSFREPWSKMEMPLFARLQSGDQRVSGHISDGTQPVHARLLRRQGRLYCYAWDDGYQPIFEGVVETSEQRRAMPTRVAKLLFAADGNLDPEVLSSDVEYRQELAARMEARFTRRDGVLHLLLRQGREARVIVDADVATPAQRAALPAQVIPLLGPEVWQELDAGSTADVISYVGSEAVGDDPPPTVQSSVTTCRTIPGVIACATSS